MSIFMGKFGRKNGFILGALLAIVGGGLGYVALDIRSFGVLCLAHMALGSALVCFNYFRFAASEVVDEPWRPVAISLVLGSGLIAAFAGPEIFNRTKDLLLPIQFAGAYLALCVTSLVGIAFLLFLNFPSVPKKPKQAISTNTPLLVILTRPTIATAILAAVVSQGVMVLMMTPTPLAMNGFQFEQSSASDVIRWHVVAMFAPSFVTGFLIKRFGAIRIVYVGLALLFGSALIAVAGIELHHFHGALILLGIGWNFGFIGSTSILATASSDDDEKARLQGVNDTMVALSAVVCSFASGWLVTSVGWSAIAWSMFPHRRHCGRQSYVAPRPESVHSENIKTRS